MALTAVREQLTVRWRVTEYRNLRTPKVITPREPDAMRRYWRPCAEPSSAIDESGPTVLQHTSVHQSCALAIPMADWDLCVWTCGQRIDSRIRTVR